MKAIMRVVWSALLLLTLPLIGSNTLFVAWAVDEQFELVEQSNEALVSVSSSSELVQTSGLVSGLDRANMDLEVRPQDDFYRHVNGNWLATRHIGDDKTVIGSFYDLRDRADYDVRAIIDDLAHSQDLTVGTNEQKIADLFHSFMDVETIDNAGTQPIQGLLDAIDALQNKADFAKFIGTYDSIGVANPLSAYIAIDTKNSSRYAAFI